MCTLETPIRGGILAALAARLTRATSLALGMLVTPACTLVTNVDREKIPVQEQPSFPQTNDGGVDGDAAPPGEGDPDAAVASDAGDAAAGDAAPLSDAAPPADAGDSGTSADAN
jgi:hypothetical protein